MDPRSNVAMDEYETKNELLSKIDSDIDNIYASLITLQNVRNQLNELNGRIGKDEEYNGIIDLSKKTMKLIDETESQLISPRQKTFQDVINFRNQLDSQLYDLLNTVNGNIPPLTGGEKVRYVDLHQKWVTIKVGVDTIIDNVSEINNLLKQNSVPYISGGGK